MLIPHAVPATPLDVLPVSLGRLEVVFIVRRNAVELAQGFCLQLDRPGGKPLMRPLLQPLVHVLLGLLERGAFWVVLPDVFQKILNVLPVRFVGVEGKYLLSVRAIRHGLFFALPEGQHPLEPFVGLLVQVLGVRLVLPAHAGTSFAQVISSKYHI